MRNSRRFEAVAMIAATACVLVAADTLAQSPYPYPYGAVSPNYQRPERHAATQPVSYTFPVRRDFATAYALQTDPRWGKVPQPMGVQPVTAYRPVTQLNQPNYSSHFAGYPGYGQTGCRSGFHPATTAPRVTPPRYSGDGLFGSPKLYTDGEPVRNFLRFLTP